MASSNTLVQTIIIFTVVESILIASLIGAFLLGYISSTFLFVGVVAAMVVFAMGVMPTILKSRAGR